MPDMFVLVLAWVAGLMLGVVFFGGLWWTVQRALHSPRPATWFLLSLLARTAVLVAGLYLVAGSDWRRLAACLVGIVSGRVFVMRMTRPDSDRRESRETASDAP